MQMRQRGFLLYARPDRLNAIAAGKMTDAGQAEPEAGCTDAGQSGIDIVHVAAIDIAEETERDVKIFGWHPTRARKSAAEKAQLPAHGFGQAQGNKETHRSNAPVLRSAWIPRPANRRSSLR